MLFCTIGAHPSEGWTDYQILHNFSGYSKDGDNPKGSLAQDSAYLYGVTQRGGGTGNGVIFRSSTDGTDYTILHSFSKNITNDGKQPMGSLTLVDSTLYGMTNFGGSASNGGVIFKINTDGTGYTILHRFNDGTVANDGYWASEYWAFGSLTSSGSTLYGMTYHGGSTNNGGIIFKINMDGSDYTILHRFNDGTVANDGYWAPGTLTVFGSTLYGTTAYGGSLSCGYGNGCGVLFRINTDGSDYIILHTFGDGSVANDGKFPMGDLALVGSALYGTTYSGSSLDKGMIFKVNTDGSEYNTLHIFGDASVTNDGASPLGSLATVASKIYGLTVLGGNPGCGYDNGCGVVFELNTDGSGYTILHTFEGQTVKSDGYWPQGGLALSDSNLYGMTYEGGTQGHGTVFSLTGVAPTIPGAPTEVQATAGNAQATVSFTSPASNGGSPISSYRVVSTPGGITATGTGSPLTVIGLTNGTAYTFTVTATNAVGTGPPSSPSSSVTPATVPGPPRDVSATPGNSQATVAFTPPASNGGSPITLYTVTSNPDGVTVTGVGSPMTVSGLANGNAYTFTVTATNAVGTGPPSSSSNSVTPAAPTVPGAPTGTTATAGNARATVSFTPPVSNGGSPITSYTVVSNPGNITATGAESPITVQGLINGTTYRFTVSASNAFGTGPASSPSNEVTPKVILISPTGSIQSYTPTYTWSADPNSTWYALYVNDSSGNRINTWYTAEQAGCSGGTGICNVSPGTALVPGSAVWWIRSWNSNGYSLWSDGMPFAVPPGKAALEYPSGTINTSVPGYKWNAVPGSTWYWLYVDDSSGNRISTWYTAEQAGCSSGTGTCSVSPGTALTPGSAVWWVETYGPNGYGPWSDGLSFSVPPGKASLLSPSGTINTTTPNYTWNAVPGSTWYWLYVNDSSGNRTSTWYTAEQSGCSSGTGTCGVSPGTILAPGSAIWWVQTYGPNGYGPWSDGLPFAVSPSKQSKQN
jgi:uncharacterized repeat protein (TIGR03803 family)